MEDGPKREPDGIALSELLGILNGSGLRSASARVSRWLPLTSPTLFDRWMPPTGPRSGILLAIGVHPGAPESVEVLRDAARIGFGAVVVKALAQDVQPLATLADDLDIALLVVDDEIEWRQLEALINAALSTASEAGTSPVTLVVGDLFALANAIAASIGGATSIENLQQNILAYSTLPGQPIDEDRREGILGRQVPDLPENAEQYAALFRAPGALRIAGVPPALDRLAVAVRAGTQALGSIWVVEASGVLDADAAGALERAADIAALHLLRARSAADLAKQQRSELLRRLLEGGEDALLVVRQLGLDRAGPFTVLAISPRIEGHELRLDRLADLVAMACQAHQSGTECVLIGNTVYAVFSGVGSETTRVEASAARLADRAAASLRVPVRASVGSQVASVGQIARSRRDADLVLLIMANDAAHGPVTSARDVRSQLSLLELGQVLRDTPRLFSYSAQAVLDLDARSGTDYAATLRTYLDCGRDSARTAALLSVHQNTLRYRLRRVHELFGINLDHADDTLMLWLSLRVVD
ncbi:MULTISPECIES: helix-turn-helix domain-containing protein [unclassified Cryobacterium]|uniref:helix-turn-helix domain-containing protein n=1 Tax=unclassified Cryobacterium TaxID=2649013 RepID=UPI000CE2F36E|nr:MULTISPECIES: helix-turn-helix domain-containing protein [unclassified Cryobacterium]